jgi:N-acetylornithine carbamoyltransferase
MKDLDEDRREPVLGAFARHADVPVLNLESATRHPCQGLADALTLNQAFGHARGRRVTLTWAYHPRALPMAVPNSFVLAASRLGVELTIAHPEGWELDPSVLESARANAGETGGSVRLTHDRDEGARGAEAVYAKSWGGAGWYGRPAEEETQAKAGLRRWIVDEDWMRRSDDAWFLHCLPVRRNVVASDTVLDGPRSLVRKQARNRVHAQEAVLLRALASA